jgi:carbon monoxide dehydrogenase subunit G
MKIEKAFEVSRPRSVVWDAMGDVRLVAECLPGASIVDDLGESRYKGRFSIKLGPLAAAFDGDVSIERRAEDWSGVVSGKGSDARSSSRASGSLTYRLVSTGPSTTQVAVVSEINLAGALAQFGKAGVIQEVATRLTAEFVENFEARLSGPAGATEVASASGSAPAESSPRPAEALNAGGLIWAVVKDRVLRLLRRLTGRQGA